MLSVAMLKLLRIASSRIISKIVFFLHKEIYFLELMPTMVCTRSNYAPLRLYRVLLLTVAVLIACAIFLDAPAFGRARVNSRPNVQTRSDPVDIHAAPRATPVSIAPRPVSTREPDYVIEDPDSGVTLSYFRSDSTLESERDLFHVENLRVVDGEGCLHAEGECDACDQLRDLYRDGEITELHRVSLSPAVECDGTFRLTIPLVSDSDACELYRCDGGTLESTHWTLVSEEQGVEKVYLSGDGVGIQSPFGIAFGRSDSKGFSAQRIEVHARIPPDDDEPEDKELEEDEEEGTDEELSAKEQSSTHREPGADSFPSLMYIVAAAVFLCLFWMGYKRS